MIGLPAPEPISWAQITVIVFVSGAAMAAVVLATVGSESGRLSVTRPAVDPKRTNLRAVPTTFELVDGCLPDYAAPGTFELRPNSNHLLLACPGCGKVSGMNVGDPKPKQTPSWLCVGPPAEPTLSPSINCVGCCGWHGYLVGGVFTC